jgi:MFS family permease
MLAFEPRIDKRLRAAKAASNWTFNAVMLAFASGAVIVAYWYVAFASSPFPSDVAFNPYVIQFEWVFYIGGVLGILSFLQLSLALIVGRFPQSPLIDILSIRTARTFGRRVARSASWITVIIGISALEYLWGTVFAGYLQLLLTRGFEVFNVYGWILFGSVCVNFVGYVMLFYGFLPITPFMSKRYYRAGLLLVMMPIFALVVILLSITLRSV